MQINIYHTSEKIRPHTHVIYIYTYTLCIWKCVNTRISNFRVSNALLTHIRIYIYTCLGVYATFPVFTGQKWISRPPCHKTNHTPQGDDLKNHGSTLGNGELSHTVATLACITLCFCQTLVFQMLQEMWNVSVESILCETFHWNASFWVSICYHRLYSINNNHSTGSSPDRQERRMSKGNRTTQVRPTWCAWWTVGVHRLPNNKHSKLTEIFDLSNKNSHQHAACPSKIMNCGAHFVT